MRVRSMALSLLLTTSFGINILTAQVFPFPKYSRIAWGMSLGDLRKALPNGEIKIEKGKTFYMVPDSIFGVPLQSAISLSSNDSRVESLHIMIFRSKTQSAAKFEQSSNEVITLLTSFHGNPSVDKKLMGIRAMKWSDRNSEILFLASNDLTSLT